MTADCVVSIIIPAHNAERTLAKTLESVIEQVDPRWEALIVDDCSTDGTPTIIDQCVQRDSRFVALSSHARCASVARNVGIANAKAERLLFLDSDDWIDNHFLCKMNAALDKNPSAVAAYCNYCRVMPDGTESPVRGDGCIEEAPLESFARSCATVIHSVLVKRAAVLAIGGFDATLRTCEDWDLWQRVARLGGNWIHVSERLSYYRASDSSLTQDVACMMADAKIVIARGFSAGSGRESSSAVFKDDPSTRPLGSAATAYAYFCLWCAGFDCGRGQAPPTISGLLGDIPKTDAAADVIISILLDSIMVGARTVPAKLARHWANYGGPTAHLISEIGQAWNDLDAARKIQYSFERKLLDFDDLSEPRALSLTYGLRVDLRRLSPIAPIGGIDRLYIYLCDGPRILALLDVGVLGEIGPDFWMELFTGHIGNLPIDKRVGKVVWLKLRAYELRRRLKRLLSREFIELRSSSSTEHASRLQRLKAVAYEQAAPLAESDSVASRYSRPRGVERARDVGRELFWEGLFEEEDPWNYGSRYEQEKFDRQLDLLPAKAPERALELACAEGHFTLQLAARVKHLVSSDISVKAIERARTRCKALSNVDFVHLDLSTDAIPKDMDLIVCSEVLYYLDDQAELDRVAKRLAQSLRPGGHLLTAHAFILKDNMSRTGFDWENPFGAEKISQVMESVPGLALEASIQTELYRVDRYRRLYPGELASAPHVQNAPVNAPIETEVARFIVWDGAVARRLELAGSERNSHIPVLMYHRIAADGPEQLARYRLRPEAFRAQMRWLRRNGYHTINSEQLAWFIENNHPFVGRPVLITFDDGYEDFAENAWPILQENDFSAEVFIVTDLVGTRSEWDTSAGSPAPLMSAARISELAMEGATFGSHLASHSRADGLSTRKLAEELTRSRAQLEKWLGRPVTSLAAPFGRTDQRLRILAAECGFKIGFSTVNSVVRLTNDLLDLPRIEVRGDSTFDKFVNCMEAYR